MGNEYSGMPTSLKISEFYPKSASGQVTPLSASHLGLPQKSHVESALLHLHCPPKGCASITISSRLKGPTWGTLRNHPRICFCVELTPHRSSQPRATWQDSLVYEQDANINSRVSVGKGQTLFQSLQRHLKISRV